MLLRISRFPIPIMLKATTILEWLDERHPARFSVSQLRTLPFTSAANVSP